MIGIIDYKAGNAPSVLNALTHLNIDSQLVSTPDEILDSSSLILPGVGSAKETMQSLKELEVLGAIEQKVVKEKVPFLGICVGFQLLFEHSEEDDTSCLGWLKGSVKRFSEEHVRIPQIGWNQVQIEKESILISKSEPSFFYFVNSYFAVPANRENILGSTNYGETFCSMVEKDNIYGTQFHVEKSGEVGLTILKNFSLLGKGKQNVN